MNVDFGTYHHSTPEESNQIREYAQKAFTKLLRPLYPPRAALRILDAGCGLGFLTYVAARCFPKAIITGVDLFRRGSMSELSMDKAANNMKSLRIDSRTSLLKHDIPAKSLRSKPHQIAPLGTELSYTRKSGISRSLSSRGSMESQTSVWARCVGN